MIATINERIYRLAAAIRQGATVDTTLAAVRAELEGQRRRSVADIASLIRAATPIRARSTNCRCSRPTRSTPCSPTNADGAAPAMNRG